MKHLLFKKIISFFFLWPGIIFPFSSVTLFSVECLAF